MQNHGFTEVQAVANAAVPIVKMVDGRGSGLHVDICFNNMLGVANTRSAPKQFCSIAALLGCKIGRFVTIAKHAGCAIVNSVYFDYLVITQAPQDILRARVVRATAGPHRQTLGKTAKDERCIIRHSIVICIRHTGHPLLTSTVRPLSDCIPLYMQPTTVFADICS